MMSQWADQVHCGQQLWFNSWVCNWKLYTHWITAPDHEAGTLPAVP